MIKSWTLAAADSVAGAGGDGGGEIVEATLRRFVRTGVRVGYIEVGGAVLPEYEPEIGRGGVLSTALKSYVLDSRGVEGAGEFSADRFGKAGVLSFSRAV